MPEAETCPSCGGESPSGSRFCPHCGTRLEASAADETATIPPPPHETAPAPATPAVAEPRLFGVTPPVTLLVLAVASFVVGTAALVEGTRIVAGVLLALGVLLLVMFFGVASRRPDGRVATAAADGLARSRDRLGSASGTWGIRAWAQRESARVRAQRGRVAVEREELVRDLGRAAYAGDAGREAGLRARLAELERRDEELGRELDRIGEEAGRRLGRTRLQAQPTESAPAPIRRSE